MLWTPAPASGGVVSTAGGVLAASGERSGNRQDNRVQGAVGDWHGGIRSDDGRRGGGRRRGDRRRWHGRGRRRRRRGGWGGQKGVGAVTNVICGGGSGVAGTVAKTAVGAVAAAATFDLAAHWIISAAQKINRSHRRSDHELDLARPGVSVV